LREVEFGNHPLWLLFQGLTGNIGAQGDQGRKGTAVSNVAISDLVMKRLMFPD